VRPDSPAATFLSRRPTMAMLAGFGMATVLLIVIVVSWPTSHPPHAVTTARQVDTAATSAANLPFDTGPAANPCQGLTGDLVTDHDGNQTSPLNVVAALEYAFYVKRDANAVTALYLPGVLNDNAKTGISGFIAHIPAGVRYCVAATATGTNVVNYDIRDIRPGPDHAANSAPTTKNFAMTLTVTSSAPYYISTLHTRK
jgi:hypothetical protein